MRTIVVCIRNAIGHRPGRQGRLLMRSGVVYSCYAIGYRPVSVCGGASKECRSKFFHKQKKAPRNGELFELIAKNRYRAL